GYATEARSRGLAVARLTSFPSVVYAGTASQLATVIAADGAYPLRGGLRVADVPYGAARPAIGSPRAGETWADSRLLARLGVPVGGTLQVGALALRVTAVLDYRPDQGSGLADLAPTVLVAAADVAPSRLLGPGSRATWSLLFAGPADAVDSFEAWLRPRKSAAERLVDAGESSQQMKSATERSGRFLNLAALVTVLLAAVAVAMAARRYAARRLDVVALLKSLGASQGFVLGVTAIELALVALAGAAVGTLLGLGAESGLAWLVRDLLKGVLPPPTLTPVWLGLGTAVTMLAGFALPPLLELRRVPPARVLRHDADQSVSLFKVECIEIEQHIGSHK
ncbi:MAG: FtsX-like permease family protein, partial [Deltaproteobacteria bacterium]